MRLFYRAKYAKQQKVRLPLSAYLTYLLIATLLVTGVSFSKFASTGGADDSARVAVVVVDGGSYDEEADLSLGDGVESEEYSFYITNENANGQVSEVSLDYTVVVTIPGEENLPKGVDMFLTYSYDVYDDDGEWLETVKETFTSVSSKNGVYTFDGGADFVAGEWAQHDYILTFTMTDESQITEDYSFEGIEISVKAEQID